MILVPAVRVRKILTIGLPIVGGMVSGVLLGLIDTAMVGTLGTTPLAAVGLMIAINGNGYMLAMMLSVATGPGSYSRYRYRRRRGSDRTLLPGAR